MNTNIEERVRWVVVAQFGVDYDETGRNAFFTDDLGADSLDSVELQLALEDEFCLDETREDVAVQIQTVGQAVDYIEKAIAARATLEGGEHGN